jgi:type I restriction enzyme S subunit
MFPIPSLPEQNAIAAILGVLDDKIQLHQQMNRTFEEINSAIFKHWFVDFDFLDGEGKPYKTSGGRMLYNEQLGRDLPIGWKVGKMSDIAVQIKEQILPVERPEQIFNHYSIEAYDSGMMPIAQTGSEILSNKFVVHDNTILVSKLNPQIQRIWPTIKTKENSICSTEFLVFKLKPNLFSYSYCLIISANVKTILTQMRRGTSGSHQRISADDLLTMTIIIPSQEILELFEKIGFTNLSMLEENRNSQLKLADLRDSLLPRLMSGKIRIPVEAK